MNNNCKGIKQAMSIRNLMDARTCNDDLSSDSLDDDGDDDESLFNSSHGESSRPGDCKEINPVDNEARVIQVLRIMILVVLLATGAMAASTVYFSNEHKMEHAAKEVKIDATNLIRTVHTNMAHMIQVIDDLSTELSARGENNWPFVTFDDFDLNGAKKRAHGGFDAIMLLPLVDKANLPAWQNYTTAERKWLMESLNARRGLDYVVPAANVTRFHSIHGISGSVHDEPGPFLPLWQLSPASLDTTLYNTDFMSFPDFVHQFEAVLGNGTAAFGSLVDLSSSRSAFTSILDDVASHSGATIGKSEPFGTFFYPIVSHDQVNSTIVGVLATTFRWSRLFKAIPDIGPFAAVLDDSVMSIGFLVQDGQATPLDAVDALDNQDDVAVASSDSSFMTFTASEKVAPVQNNGISMRVYSTSAEPTERFPESAGLFAGLVAMLFVLLVMLFSLYDCIVQRRQREVHEAAVRSTKIVTSLFPNRVADRLFQTEDARSHDVEQDTLEEADVKATFFSHDGSSAGLVKESAKHKLKQVMNTDGNIYDGTGTLQNEKPIADLFPASTVMFADIVGFTAFASERPPEQVFQLLQSVYQAFDKAARKRHVFKVETIGDCYVACTGLPDPQPSHAVIMAGFAIHCRSKMKEVTRKLERVLGPDTSSLQMRFGLHSGPVIAGVLRGERARFQLFGDTVNLAARMESTGQKDCIQVSEATATLLMEGGKGNWVKPREDLVSVKGKGQMKTFWLETRDGHAQRTKLLNQISCDSFDGPPPEEPIKPKAPYAVVSGRDALKAAKKEIWARSEVDMPAPTTLKRGTSDATGRLIDWNTQILLDLLKPVVAHRLATKGFASKKEDVVLTSLKLGEGTALDEVREIIELPSVDSDKPIQHIDPDSIELDVDVETQLRDFVTGVASMYRDNPFHNYAHACHVQMSMVKLLNRIVSPESVDYNGTKDAIASDAAIYSFGITSSPLTSFAVVFSALVHDVDHTGVSNAQLFKENAPVATFYKGKSVAEQNSIDLAWELLMQPSFKELRGCIFADQSEFDQFRALIVNIVLATDIFDKELSALRKDRWNKAFSEESLSEPVQVQVNRKATIVIEHLIQASDVAHTMQHWEIYRKWNERLFFEMYIAFKTGRVDVDPSVGWYKGEIWFFDNYVVPLAKKLKDCGVFGVSSDECLDYALENRRIWVERGEDLVKEMLATDYFEKMDDAKKTRRSRRKQNKLNISLD